MSFWLTVILSNFGVGGLVGLTGVAGFLLPIVYTGLLQMSVTQGLALSFAAFILSGALGSFNYKKAGNLDVSFGLRLSAGSLAGAVLGVKLNLIIPEEQVKILLYVVVLLSGISILLRKDGKAAETEKKAAAGAAGAKEKGFRLEEHLVPTLLLGFVTGLICALSGAGGPILVMPLLVVFGTGVRVAVGIALFNSIFIGIPACIGYMSQCDVPALLPVLAAALASHSVGVYLGSKNAVRINQGVLKRGIAVFSILIAVWKLFL